MMWSRYLWLFEVVQLYGGEGFMRWMKKGAGDESGGVYGSENLLFRE